MPRYLVIANETLGGQLLLDEIRSRHDRDSSRFFLVVPAAPPKEGFTWTEAEAEGLARDRLERVLSDLRRHGVEGTGRVGDADPFLAIQDALREDGYDEIILSSSSQSSGWFRPELEQRVRTSFGLPVTYLPGEPEDAVRETALMRSPLFSELPKRHLHALAKLSTIQNYREGMPIVEEHSSGSDVYAILDGRVRVVREGHTLAHLSPGDVFGEISLLAPAPGPRTDALIAQGPTRCLQLSGQDFREATERDPELALKFLEAAGARLHQLSRNFQDLVMSLNLEGEVLERLAEATHVAFSADELAKGMSWGEPTDEYLKRHEALRPYAGRTRDPARTSPSLVGFDKLPEELKEQNRDLVQDIPNKLAAAGYILRKAEGERRPEAFAEEEVELLAEQEHERWVLLKLAQGWSFAATRDEDERRHPDIVPWQDLGPEERQQRYGMDGASRVGPGTLAEDEKEKDRALVRRMGTILSSTGYTPTKVEPPVG
jgi:CRP-like cAMP-binding protein